METLIPGDEVAQPRSQHPHSDESGIAFGQRPLPKRTVYHLMTETEPFSEYDGGAISRWAANVLHDDRESVILCPVFDDSWGFATQRMKSIPLLHFYRRVSRRVKARSWGIQRLVFRRMLKRGLDMLQPGDVLWIHNRPDFAAAVAPIVHAKKAKLVLHLHNSHLVEASQALLDDLKTDHIIFVSEFLMKQSLGKLPGLTNCSVIRNGANRQLFYPRAEGVAENPIPKVLFASRLVPEKGAHLFQDAMRMLTERGVAIQGAIVGASHFGASKPNKYMEELRTAAPANVEVLDYCAGMKLADLFREADIFCCPSIWQEPFGMVNVEAMACRLPVVATRSGGIPEAFRDGGALLVERGSVEELADALERLALDPALRREIGEAGMASYQRSFTWDAVQQNYARVLAAL